MPAFSRTCTCSRRALTREPGITIGRLPDIAGTLRVGARVRGEHALLGLGALRKCDRKYRVPTAACSFNRQPRGWRHCRTQFAGITVSATAANGLQSVQCRIDLGAWQTMTSSGGNYIYTWNTNGLGNLTHAVEARATDNRGNITQTLTNYVKTGTGLQQSPVVNQLERATWIWEPDAYQMVASSGPETMLNAFFSNLPNTVHEGETIYLYADRYNGHYAIVENPQGYANLISWAHIQGYKVDALLASGFYASQMYSYDRYQNNVVQLIDNVLNYNIAFPSAT